MSCSEKYSYLNRIEFTSKVYHCLTIFEVPLHIYVGFLIIFNTPKCMGTVKWYMFNVHFWISLLDISFSFLTAPYILFPTLSGYGSGFLMWLRVHPYIQTGVIVVEIGNTILSIAVLFENRYTILAASYGFWNYVRKSCLVCFYLAAWLYFFPFYYMIPEQKTALSIIKEKLPSVRCFYSGTIFVVTLDPALISLSTTAMLMLEFGSILVVGLLTYIAFRSQKRKFSLSKNTLAMQRRFFISITIQTLIPLGIIALPLCYCAFSLVQGYYSQAMNNICFLIISNHGIVTTFSIIFIHKPYREATFPCFEARRNRRKKAFSVALPVEF